MDEITNKVANSKLLTIDLEDYYPQGKRVLFDIKPWLFQELILKEKDFRAFVEAYDWSLLKNQYLALHCSSDAIIPSWAYLLIASKAAAFARKIVVGDLVALETSLYQDLLQKIDVSKYTARPVILKGCADKPIPPTAYTLLIEKLLPVVSSILYGEACSTVPLFKKKKA
tara:strand:+ start:20176 stop:20685 length:510 start_codon:yes stop_codon:yes gene_type:complete